ncbi:MAG: DUF4845 domain-containing protein [Moraxellaceae bacterium]|nr:DUF4845 domain-containing protein [Moraxellaceae bacterium]
MNYQLPTLASQQRGEGVGGFVSIVIIIVMCLKLGIAIIPAQWKDHQLDKAIAEELVKANRDKSSKTALLDAISRQLDINAMYNVKLDEMYTVKGDIGNLSIKKKYQVESNLFFNVFITNKFEGKITPEMAK